MSTQHSQALTEMFNIKTSIQSMTAGNVESHGDAVHDAHAENHPLETSRNPELFSELCC